MQNYYNPLRIIFDPIAFRYHQKLFDQKKKISWFLASLLSQNFFIQIQTTQQQIKKFFSNLSDRAKFKIESSLNTKREEKKEKRKKGKRKLLNGNFIVNGNDKS